MLLYNLCAHYILFTIKPHRTSHIGNACFSYLNPSHWQCPFFISERTTLAMPFLLFQHTTKAMPVSLIPTTHIGNARFSYLNHPTPQSVCYVMPFADRVSCTNSESCIVWTRLYCYILRCVRVKLVKKQHRKMLYCMSTRQNSPGTYQCQQNLHNYWESPFLWYKRK